MTSRSRGAGSRRQVCHFREAWKQGREGMWRRFSANSPALVPSAFSSDWFSRANGVPGLHFGGMRPHDQLRFSSFLLFFFLQGNSEQSWVSSRCHAHSTGHGLGRSNTVHSGSGGSVILGLLWRAMDDSDLILNPSI